MISIFEENTLIGVYISVASQRPVNSNRRKVFYAGQRDAFQRCFYLGPSDATIGFLE
jgi:hypothetical protein